MSSSQILVELKITQFVLVCQSNQKNYFDFFLNTNFENCFYFLIPKFYRGKKVTIIYSSSHTVIISFCMFYQQFYSLVTHGLQKLNYYMPVTRDTSYTKVCIIRVHHQL